MSWFKGNTNKEKPVPTQAQIDAFMNTLSDAQKQSITNWKLDVSKILTIPNQSQKADTSKLSSWTPGNNFENAVLVGYRTTIDEHNNDPVYLKVDGWFTTPTDATNCNPMWMDRNPRFMEGKGYTFQDMTSQAISSVTPVGGTRKRTKRRLNSKSKSKRRLKSKSKSKRRYRK